MSHFPHSATVPDVVWIGRPGPDANWSLFLKQQDAIDAEAAGWEICWCTVWGHIGAR